MQFLPSTWRRYGMGGDIEDPHDAILGAANYLAHAGAASSLDRALFAYNHSTSYVRAIRRFAARMRTDPRTFLTYYAWRSSSARRTAGPGGSPDPGAAITASSRAIHRPPHGRDPTG
jgi:hypothetical protein